MYLGFAGFTAILAVDAAGELGVGVLGEVVFEVGILVESVLDGTPTEVFE